MSGVVHLTGFPDGPPVHTGFSHADSITGLFGAFAIQTALYRKLSDPEFEGELIDLALYEGLYRLIEWQVIFYDQMGTSPMRAGNRLANAPAAVINMYKASDGTWITVTTGTWKSVQLVAALLGEPAEDYDSPEKQAARADHLDGLLNAYIGQRSTDEVLAAMAKADIVASVIYDVETIVNDKTYAERGDVVTIQDEELGPVRMQAVLPHLTNHPGRIWRSGPSLGEDNELVYKQFIGMSDEEYDTLVAQGVI
jgi:formyl-CoA transferase